MRHNATVKTSLLRNGWIRSAGWALSLAFGVIVGSFLLFQVAPGDPARIMLGPSASEEAVVRLRGDLGLDRPLAAQFTSRITAILRLELGRSVIDGRLVHEEVVEKFLVTGRLGFLAAGIALTVSYFINLLVFLVPRSRPIFLVVKVGIVTPTYCVGVFATIFIGLVVPFVSLSGFGRLDGGVGSLLVPAIIIALYPSAVMTEILRAKIMSSSSTSYARASEAFGTQRISHYHHALLRPSLVSWLAAWVNQISIIFVSTFIIEAIFTIPGIGVLLISSIQQKDLPMLQGILLANAAFFIMIIFSSEMFFRIIDPRIRCANA